jgi:Tol biopolymer transport system component
LRKLIIPAIAAAVIAIGAILLIFLSNRQPSKQPIVPSHKQLTFTGDVIFPAISPDGKFIAYVTGPTSGGQKIWVQDMASGHSIEVFSADVCANLCWTPDGSEVTVFARIDSKNRYRTFLVPRFGGQPRQIEVYQYITWSPDGSQFAGADMGSNSIRIVNQLTGRISFFKLDDPILFTYGIDWSPAGNRLLVLVKNKESKYMIWTARTDGKEQNLVFEDRARLFSPRWASKGNAIFYLREVSSRQGELWKLPISIDTGKPAKPSSLVLSGIPMGAFAMSADGKYLLYTRELNFSNLWFAKLEGSEKSRTVKTQQLTSGTSLYETPSISPDGKRIAFSKGDGKNMNIYVMPTEGGNPTQLTFFNSYNSNPVWSLDGQEIAFGSNEGGQFKVWKVGSQGEKLYQFAKTELAGLGGDHQIVWDPMPNIMYQKKGNQNFQILNPKTEEEGSLVKNEPVGWLFFPYFSPDRKKVVVLWNRPSARGLWVVFLDDFSEKPLFKSLADVRTLGWSADGRWVYAYVVTSGEKEYLMIEVESGRAKPLPTIPFTIEGKTYHKVIDPKPEILIDAIKQSDVWVIENFDQIIK